MEKELNERKVKYLKKSVGTEMQKLESLLRFMSRQDLAKLCCYIDVFNKTKGVTGSIIECGVYFGNGLMAWAKLSSALEPYNYNCKIIGFDTFCGNKGISDIDILKQCRERFEQSEGGYYADFYDDLLECISIFDADRPLNKFPKVELVKGDLCETAPQYIKAHEELVVRILCLSVNLYKPTKAALKAFLPRMPKGSIIVVFTLNSVYPGVTLATVEELGIRDVKVRMFDYYPNFNYIIL